MSFAERLHRAQVVSNSLACVGLDPEAAKIPSDLRGRAQSLYAFNRRIIDATFDIVAAYKPQIAFYGAVGAEAELAASIRYIRERAPQALVLLDAKRSDIGNTAEMYAREAFDRYGADAVTVNPYMGEDSIRPFLERPERGAVLLCRTSNAGAKDFQDLIVDGLPLVPARRAAGGGGLEPAAEFDAGRRRNLPAGNGRPAPRPPRAAVPGPRDRRPRRRSRGDARGGPRRGRRRAADQFLARHHLRGRRLDRIDSRGRAAIARSRSMRGAQAPDRLPQ